MFNLSEKKMPEWFSHSATSVGSNLEGGTVNIFSRSNFREVCVIPFGRQHSEPHRPSGGR